MSTVIRATYLYIYFTTRRSKNEAKKMNGLIGLYKFVGCMQKISFLFSATTYKNDHLWLNKENI
jgi:hypothetical protein